MAMDAVSSVEDATARVDVYLASADVTIAALREFRAGTVLELDKMANEPVDLRVGSTVIARGEVVVINDQFGIRVTEVAAAESEAEARS